VTLFGHDFGLRFEGAFTIPDNSRAESAPPEFRDDLRRDRTVHAVAGADFTFPGSILGTTLYLNAQYVHYHSFESRQRAQPGYTIVSGMPNLFPWGRNLVFFVEDRIPGGQAALSFSGITDLARGDAFLSPGMSYAFAEGWKANAHYDAFVGDSNGFYGQFADQRRLGLGLRYAF